MNFENLLMAIRSWMRSNGLKAEEAVQKIGEALMNEPVGFVRIPVPGCRPVMTFGDKGKSKPGSGGLSLAEDQELKRFHEQFNRGKLDPKQERRFIALLDKNTAAFKAARKGGTA